MVELDVHVVYLKAGYSGGLVLSLMSMLYTLRLVYIAGGLSG